MAVKYLSTEDSPLLYKYGYGSSSNGQIRVEEYMPSYTNTNTYSSSSSSSRFATRSSFHSPFQKYTKLLFMFWVLLCIALAGLTGFVFNAKEHGNTESSNTGSNTSTDSNANYRRNTPASSKQKYKKNKNQIMAEKALHENLLKPDSGTYSSSKGKSTSHAKNQLPDPCHASIVIIRHCEKKGAFTGHCSHVGYQRAKYIAKLFGGNDSDNNNDGNVDDDDDDIVEHHISAPTTTLPTPSYLFGTAPGYRMNPKVKNYREIETLEPLSRKIGVAVNSHFGMNNRGTFTKHLFTLVRSGDLCGKVALISWKHEDIPRLARSLGCGPEDGCPTSWKSDDFDSMWQISYSYQGEENPTLAMTKVDTKAKSKKQHPPQWWISAQVEKEDFDLVAFKKEQVHKKWKWPKIFRNGGR